MTDVCSRYRLVGITDIPLAEEKAKRLITWIYLHPTYFSAICKLPDLST